MKFSLERWGILEAIRNPEWLRGVVWVFGRVRYGSLDSQKLPNLMSIRELRGALLGRWKLGGAF